MSDDWLKTVFDNHEIKTVCDHSAVKRFTFRRSDSGEYGFAVTFADNLIVMNGDIGTMVVEPGYGRDGLAFLRGSLKSPSYFLSKVPHEIRQSMKEYKREYAIESMREWLEAEYINKKQFEEFCEELCTEDGTYGEMKYYELCYEMNIEEPPTPTRLKSQTEIQLVGLEKFLERLETS